MLTHGKIWTAIDALARRYGLSPSGLAKKAGLDPTSFNPSKRVTNEGRPRWPTTESVAKVLDATGASLDDFVALVEAQRSSRRKLAQPIPLIGLTQAGAGGFFDDGGFPVGHGWDQIRFPKVDDDNAYALEVTGDSMQPLYRKGDILVISPNAQARKGDRVVVRTVDGEVLAKILVKRTAKTVELASFNPNHANLVFPVARIDWIARIVWASQ
ncbi:MAG: helix-turn-helix transcriptional regulator [Methyloceanibacter sp.]|nr:helix-turn-helix transcriptional regulator [Methyloceanibacter sp.]